MESVTSGHPDKICDQVSDAILDAYIVQDPTSRVAVETFGSHGLFVAGGEVTSRGSVDAAKIARTFYRDLGYKDDLQIMTNIVQQSPDIAQALVHKLVQGLEHLRKTDPECSWLGPDGKSQITMEDGKVRTVLISCQHADSIEQPQIKEILTRKLIGPVMGDLTGIEVLVNPTGKFIIGGFAADTGLTGRKIIVDTYGGLVRHGGGCFSGKDPTKVDRSAAYMARFAAKNVVANGLAKECTIAMAYAIGRAEPLMVYAEAEDGRDVSAVVKEKFDFRPRAIIERLNLRRPIYAATAAYGHFGREGFPWEEIISL